MVSTFSFVSFGLILVGLCSGYSYEEDFTSTYGPVKVEQPNRDGKYPTERPTTSDFHHDHDDDDEHQMSQWGGPRKEHPEKNPVYDPYSGRRKENSPLEPRVRKYGYPKDCVKDLKIENTKCDYMLIVTINASEGYAHFEMSRKMDKNYGYVAVGLSQDEKMDDDHVVECIKTEKSAHPRMYHSWSNFHNRPSRLPDDSHLIRNKLENFDAQKKILKCEFDRPLFSEVKYDKGDGVKKSQQFDMTREKFIILMAIGEPTKPDSEILGQHGPKSFGSVSIFKPEEDYYYYSSGSKVEMGMITFSIILFISYFIQH